ncbi:class I SAM-dependent methyltransferase [Methylobacterium durans]|uniref:Class I SAM-dependent methyltransferase n=1 Tax=Methylobacterium durans TaxID=2202825 RepID=A0A2U8W9I6_9HYPH|nr:class I SAM-dependent methyltransferase [Methylobacterium durans]AWN41992.1 class I SAM-dependent methyltransferase [Methylobacterium durans]
MHHERINSLARICGARRYLEVGVFRGETFFNVNVDFKVAVDPSFPFDASAHETDRTRFHEVGSDAFFRSAPYEPFDLIFLDGLHTFEQTLRDFLNSIAFAHDRTIWLFDDTVPNDNFSALPDQERCYRLRRSLGNGDGAWMGDVFKVVHFIRSMMKIYHFRTFGGHGQTVVWRDPRHYDERFGTPLAEIGRMPYEDFIETYGAMMNLADDEQIYATIERFIADADGGLRTSP